MEWDAATETGVADTAHASWQAGQAETSQI